jgi:hypothetical protein
LNRWRTILLRRRSSILLRGRSSIVALRRSRRCAVMLLRLLMRRRGAIVALRRSWRCAVVLRRRRLLLIATVGLLRWRRTARRRIMALRLLISTLLRRILSWRRLLIPTIGLLRWGMLTITLLRRRRFYK